MKMNSLAANPHAANPPSVAIPEALTLPVTAVRIASRDIGRTAVAVVRIGAWSTVIGTRAIVVGVRNGAADDGAADDSAGNRGAQVTLGVGGRRGREDKGGNGGQCHQHFPHGITFLIEHETALSKLSVHQTFHIPLE